MSEQVDVAAAGRDGRSLDEWVVVVEGKPERAGESFDFHLVRDVLQRLREWRPSCVYHPSRLAIQLRIAAAAPCEALRYAVAYHDQAVQAVGLASCSLTGAEVLAVGEFETGRDEEPVAAPAGAGREDGASAGLEAGAEAGAQTATLSGPEAEPLAPGAQGGAGTRDEHCGLAMPGAREGLVSYELYRTTRALLWVSTQAEITDLLVGFVTAVGGSVSVGNCQPAEGMVTVPLGGGEREALHAVAETMSVAGMILERSLPSLVDDAGRVRSQLRQARA